MSDSEFYNDVGYEPMPEVTEDNSGDVFNLLEDAGAAEYIAEIDKVDQAFDTVTRVKQSGEVDQETVEALESFGFDIQSKGYQYNMFTAVPSTLHANVVVASLEDSAGKVTARLFVKAGRGFVKAVKKSFSTASDAVSLMLDNTSGMKPAIDFSVKRLDTLHSELKNAIEERGGWPTMGHEMLDDPNRPLDPYFLRDNVDKGLGAFVKRRAAAALIKQVDGKRPLVEGEIITRPEYIQRSIDTAGQALNKAVSHLNAVTDIKTLTQKPDKVRPVQDAVHEAIADLKSRLEIGSAFETSTPEDYQNFARVADTIDGAMRSIANAKLVGAGFRELVARVEALDKELMATKDDESLSEESLHAWETLAKNLKATSELYAALAQYAHHVENVADLFHRVVINARRDMVMAVEIAAEQAPGLLAKRLMLLADREKERLIEDQDAMRAARKKAQAKRSIEA